MFKKKTIITKNFNQADFTIDEIKLFCNQLCRNISLRFGMYTLSHKLHSAMGSCRYDQLFIDFYNVHKEYPSFEKIKEMPCNINIDLNTAGILTFPWNKDRLTSFLKNTRDDNFERKYDSLNHSIIHIKPFDIYLVTGGNHSIYCGMFKTGGQIQCSKEIDYTQIISDFTLCNDTFIGKDGKKYKKSFFMELNPEMEYLFLLGKLLIEKE